MNTLKPALSICLLSSTIVAQSPALYADRLVVEKQYTHTQKIDIASKPDAPRVQGRGENPTTGRDAVDGYQTENKPYYSTQCDVDFNDEQALAFSEPSLWGDRVNVPWFERCGSNFVDIRPKKYGHFHLGFADPDVEFCADNEQFYPSRINGDGSCEFVDIPTEPRTYASSHWGDEWLRIRVEDGDHFQPFVLERIRIVGNTPVRLCYKKNQETDPGEWVTSEAAGADPGVWLCWNHLDPNYWNLGDWAWDIVEARITSVDGSSSYSIDDIRIGN